MKINRDWLSSRALCCALALAPHKTDYSTDQLQAAVFTVISEYLAVGQYGVPRANREPATLCQTPKIH